GSSNSIMLLMDEVDAFLHPRWQQEALGRILDITSKIFEGKKVQIVLSTHSPILLSDLLSSHVIYLAQDESGQIKPTYRSQETFGENIYRLYKDSFFLDEKKNNDDNNLWIRGSLSNRVVNDIYREMDAIKNQLNSKEKQAGLSADELLSKLNKIKEKIDLIGEELQVKMIKVYWQNIYDCLWVERLKKMKKTEQIERQVELINELIQTLPDEAIKLLKIKRIRESGV
ncbi:MAG: ATP-binding protein, partial [Anaerovibrio sp.]|uniref:AAA family ATPase n=1 Tax=Anaerovibrio sp. TaxID=1872532 RepID=UPI0025E34432